MDETRKEREGTKRDEQRGTTRSEDEKGRWTRDEEPVEAQGGTRDEEG